ncbi:MAG: hypothetical protein WBN92_15880 [Terriglobia bacterium]
MRFFHLALPPCLLLMVCCEFGQAQQRPTTWAVDPTRPYVELLFDHIGPRTPARPGERAEGIWLRLNNNSGIPIEIAVGTGSHEVLVDHAVIKVPDDFLIEREHETGQRVASCSAGYQSGDVHSALRLEPAKTLIFSIPLNHVTKDCFVRIEVFPLMPTPVAGRQPRTFVELFWTDLPAEVQKSVTRESKAR